MPLERKANQQLKFVRVALPWILAAAIFALYCLTLNHWVSFGNIQTVANTARYNWIPQFYAPVSFLLTLPMRLLPERFIPLGLNLFAAVCGALSMALLARSVALLPHDRTQEQRERHRGAPWPLSLGAAWLPPVVAVLVCALGLSFWEYSTSANVWPIFPGGIEIFDLLMFAYVIRCLLEFRVAQHESWLFKAALVYGAAIANNWAMFSLSPPFVSFFPLFIAALISIRGLAFFNVRFLIRMFLCGLAGMSLYLVLPIFHAFNDIASPGFWTALALELKGQHWVQGIALTKMNVFLTDKPLWVLSLYSFLPVLALSIRWPSYFGDTSKLGQGIATFAFHLVHGAFLLLCLWAALDAPISPRSHSPWLPLLTLYYLSALSIGYFVGYFQLIFGTTATSSRKPSPVMLFINRSVIACVWALCILVPIALLYRNFPQIRTTNGLAFKTFAAHISRNFPTTNAVVLSDDRTRLLLLQAYAAQTGQSTNLLFLDTASFKIPEYHRFLHRKYGGRWPTDPPKDVKVAADPLKQMEVLYFLNGSNALYYAHPSFGYYFELFEEEAHGLAYKLNAVPTNTLSRPLPSAALIKENEAFWTQAEAEALKPLLSASAPVTERSKGLPDKVFKALHISREANPQAMALTRFYSRSLNYWGVRMQAARALPEAAQHFQRAIELNPDNIVAAVNLKCNRLLQAGRHADVRDPQSVLDEFGRFRSWDEVMNENGPYDEPTFCYAEGVQLANSSLFRQAVYQFERVKVLAPAHLPSRLWLANIFLLKKQPDETLKVLEEVRARPDIFPLGRTNLGEMVYLEASALLTKTNFSAAENVLKNTLEKYPDDDELLATAIHVYMNNANYTGAIPLIERRVSLYPTNIDLLLQKGFANLQAGRYEEAIPTLNRVLALETNLSETHNTALLDRAIAYLKSGKLDEARQDYETLQKNFPTAFRIYYGLGEVAYRRRDTNAAIRNYQLYLTNSPTSAEEIDSVRARLKELRPGYPSP